MRPRLALIALLALGCATPGRAVRTAAERGDVAEALRAYRSFVEARGEGDPDLLARVALATLRRLATGAEVGERNAGFSALRSIGAHGTDLLEVLAREEGVVGDRAAALLWEVNGREGAPPARLAAALASDDRERRMAGMVPLRPPGGTRALLRLLRDGDAAVRVAAAQRLGPSRSRRVTERLLARLRDDPEDDVRAACATALGSRGPEVFDALAAALDDPSSYVRMMVPAAMVAASYDDARARLGALLAGERTSLSVEAARALAVRGDNDARDYLVATLRSPQPGLRAQAAVAAATLAATHGDALREALGGDDGEVVLRVAAALTRVEAHRGAALDALRTLARSPDGFIAVRALQALAPRGEAGVLDRLREALAAPDASVRRIAVLAWGDAVGTSADCDALAPLLRDRDRSVAALAAMQIVLVAAR